MRSLKVKRSRVKRSRVKRSKVKRSKVKRSKVKRSKVKRSKVKRSKVKRSKVKRSRVKRSRMKRSKVKRSRMKGGLIMPDNNSQEEVREDDRNRAESLLEEFHIFPYTPARILIIKRLYYIIERPFTSSNVAKDLKNGTIDNLLSEAEKLEALSAGPDAIMSSSTTIETQELLKRLVSP